MITQYSKPAENPYVPQPWDMIYSMQSKKQSRIADNEQLRAAYAQQNEALRQKFEMANLERTEKMQEKALSDMEESSLLLSNVKAYGPEDTKRLNDLRGAYTERINEVAAKWGDNPFKMASAVRGLKQAVKQDMLGGDLSIINDRYKKGMRMEEITDELRMKGYYDDDYYVAQKMNVFQPVGKTPDLQGEAMAFAKAIPADSPYITSVRDLEEVIYNNMNNQFQDDKAVRLRAGRSPQEIEKMYRGIANAAANSQWQLTGKGRSGSKTGSGSTTAVSPYLHTPAYTDKQVSRNGEHPTYQPQYSTVDKKTSEDMNAYIEANIESLMFFDPVENKQMTGKEVMNQYADDNKDKPIQVLTAGRVNPGTHRYDGVTNNEQFAAPLVVQVQGKKSKQLLVQGPNDLANQYGYDINRIFESKYNKSGRQWVTKDGKAASARFIETADGGVYGLKINGNEYTGQTPDLAWKNYIASTYNRQ